MNASQVQKISPRDAKALLDGGEAVLIDIREQDEFAREHIAGARLVPLSGFTPSDFPREHEKAGVFCCASGNRTTQAAGDILATGFAKVYQIEGGLAGWKKAGLPVNLNRSAPISIQRQVQLIAGAMMLASVILGFLLTPYWFALGAFVGAGLMFAGATGTCAMATLLAYMPWNRAPALRVGMQTG
jgi:rhodanese-related sulfurtransferase